MRTFLAKCFALSTAAMAQSALATEPSVTDLAARIELRTIETITLSDQQILTGDKNGKAVTIAGELRFPRGATGRVPCRAA